jgi:hypothetical protein
MGLGARSSGPANIMHSPDEKFAFTFMQALDSQDMDSAGSENQKLLLLTYSIEETAHEKGTGLPSDSWVHCMNRDSVFTLLLTPSDPTDSQTLLELATSIELFNVDSFVEERRKTQAFTTHFSVPGEHFVQASLEGETTSSERVSRALLKCA